MDYLKKIAEMVKDGQIPKGGVQHIHIAHDDDCPKLTGKGSCNCEPEIRVVNPDEFN